MFHIWNSSCYANGNLKITFFQDDYIRDKVILDFKAGNKKLLYNSLIVCVITIAKYMQHTHSFVITIPGITFFTMTLIQNLSQKLIYFIFTKYLIIQLKHTFHNVKLYTHIHVRWKVLYEWKKLHPRKKNPGFYIKSSLSPNLLCHSLSVLWEQGLCHLWFIKGREQKGKKKDTVHQVLSRYFQCLPIVRGFIPGDIIKWQSFLLDNNP